ncbi:deoxyguanosinetriphosphate triphosphohydrolase [Leptospira sp. GIMC2001]|uniref:deoxyguanosinetriphosphate triphosphohydrolase n=1 Tax=Leptospira sp. GIMC2001 TaxID=1513297 RepID=UPI00234BAD23|nr:deoxyguanosinetriphosphate triphosphohydrolase [Leptospira sp. GIMC2001]WCL50942.1 deoxyguanosinetriphosphate triphosphohydrolase [Leptospira sp. GIMC2001]
MIKKIQDLIKDEDSKLASYALKNIENGGRIHEEEDHAYRLPFQRDKDRIIHSRAFRRLEYKTQVFIASIGDNYRNRLTHTLEVSALARTVAGSLGLNSFLSESIALAHDLGHAPFGHAGQDILAEMMDGHGGFEHNKQSLRIVQFLENRYAAFPGLNLCRETMMGIMKHGGDYEDSQELQGRKEAGPSLEAQITDLCDAIAYNNHDVEDGIESGILKVGDLSNIEIWNENFLYAKSKYPNALNTSIVRETTRAMMNSMVTDLINQIDFNLNFHNIINRKDLATSWKNGVRLVSFSESMRQKVVELKKFLHAKLYKHPDVLELSNFGKEIIEVLFNHFIKNPNLMPDSYKTRLDSDGKYRVVCDYIAGMTDRYAEEIALDLQLINPLNFP